MTKANFIVEVASHAQLTKKQAEAAVLAVTYSILKSLKNGAEAVLPGIGKFLVKDRPARVGRNPQTGDTVPIPAGKRIIFRPSKAAKDAVGRRNVAW
jgi:DNA-binding protein HU-beta